MQAIVFYITVPFIYLISALPSRLMYALSDFVYVILYHVIGYRKKVVLTNLRNAFPEKSEKEIRRICRKHYRYFCDLILETLKTLTASRSDIRDLITMEDVDIFEHYKAQDQSLIMVLGHYGNWELGGAIFSQHDIHQLYVIYHPLNNKYFDKLVYHMRTRSGTKLYAMKDTFRGMVRDRKDLTITAFIADQAAKKDRAYWTTFLNQETAVFPGTEVIARKMDYPIIYVSIKRLKRGSYLAKGEVLIANPKDTAPGEISEAHTKRLERDIIEQPEIWLWTHKRWKHKRPEGVAMHTMPD